MKEIIWQSPDGNVFTPEPERIRTMHPYGFRSGQWAVIVNRIEVKGRECYLVRFPDGMSDYWVADDPAGRYEFA